MVSLQVARAVNAALVKAQPLTAVFVGGTSGIGEYTIRALASHHGSNGPGLRLYIVGRNGDAASKIISDCQKVCPGGDFRFIKVSDLSLLREVDDCCAELTRLERESSKGQEPRIDLLYMSHADLHVAGTRRETKEGLDKTMSFLYYSRMRFIVDLMPLLTSSTLPAHVISIFGAGLEKEKDWDPNDLSLSRLGSYGWAKMRTHVVAMTTFYMEALAKQAAGKLSLTHVFPGLVMTPAFHDDQHPLWFKIVWFLASPIARLGSVSAEETGERMLFFASSRYPPQGSSGVTAKTTQGTQEIEVAMSTNGTRGGGAYSCNHKGDTNKVDDVYKAIGPTAAQLVHKHTMAVFSDIDSGKGFRG